MTISQYFWKSFSYLGQGLGRGEELRQWQIAIKAHGEESDFEQEVEASSKKEAVKKFYNMVPNAGKAEWSEEDLMPYVWEEK